MSDAQPRNNDMKPQPVSRWIVAGVAAVAVVGIILFVAGALVSISSETERANITVAQPAVTAPADTTNTVTAVNDMLVRAATQRDVTTDIQAAIDACAIPLAEAANNLRENAASRQATIDTLNSAPQTGVVAALSDALTYSVAADRARIQWIAWLQTEHAATYTTSCWPAGAAPTDANADIAQVEDAYALAARTETVLLYNPQAEAAGLRTWTANEF